MGLEQFITVLTYFFLTWSYGFTLLDIFQAKERHPAYQILAELGAGLAVFSFLGVILNPLQIPLHVNVYLLLAAAYPVYALVMSFKEESGSSNLAKTLQSRETVITSLLLIVVAAVFLLMHSGAFGYPYLENDDPWNHAQGTLYVATEHTYDVDPSVRELNTGWAFYLEPYPPTFDAIMGVLRQLNPSVIWTLKFFNALIVALTVAFSFLFLKEYFRSDEKALFGAAILAALPSFMSHFIWSQTLAIALTAMAWYAFIKALDDKDWRYPAIILIASSMVTQPVISFFTGVVIILMIAIIGLRDLKRKKRTFKLTKEALFVSVTGFVVSFIYWGVQLVKIGLGNILGQKGGEVTGGWYQPYTLQSYSLHDIVFAPHASRIDQAIGFGLIVTILVVIGLVLILLLWNKTLRLKKEWRYWHTLAWFALFAYLVFAPTLGLPGWGSSRLWVMLAFPIAILATDGAFILANSITKEERVRWATLAVALLLIGITSVPAKVAVQTAQWPPGAQWMAPQAEVPAYLEMQQSIPKGSKVFATCFGDSRSIGFDMRAEPWNLDQAVFRSRLPNVTGEEFIMFLKRHDYRYVTLDATCVRKFGENATVRLANELSGTQQLTQRVSRQGFLLAEVI